MIVVSAVLAVFLALPCLTMAEEQKKEATAEQQNKEATAEEQKQEATAVDKPASEAQPAAKRTEEGGSVREELVTKGAKIEFSAKPATGGAIMEGEFADIAFKVTDATTGSPISPLYPGAWIDLKEGGATSMAAKDFTCDQKVNLYFKGVMTFRPLLDLNSNHKEC